MMGSEMVSGYCYIRRHACMRGSGIKISDRGEATRCIRMGTRTSGSSREGRLKGTGNMCGQAKERRMRASGIRGGSMATDSGQAAMGTHTLGSGRTASPTGLEYR